MKTELLEYELPGSLVADRPVAERDGGRLLVLCGGQIEHRRFRDWPELLAPGSLVVLNDTRVRRARVLGARKSGGRVELFFLKRLSAGATERWQALGRANKPLRPGTVIEAGELVAEVIERDLGGVLTLDASAPGGIEGWLELHGHTPIPPYMHRADEALDAERYQTVYARRTASVAAPTAGLHLTPATLESLERRSIAVGQVTLEIGLGTFKPVEVSDLDQHPMHAETFAVSAELASQIAETRARGGAVVAVGTTVVRALETAADPERPGQVLPLQGETKLLIQPGFRFRVIDALLTNFHQPRSTLLALVSAFAGYDAVRNAYREAVAERYRFLSYGDAMWLPERDEASAR